VRDHDLVRRALGARYSHILVDEFQDTDPVQAEILFRIASDECAADWQCIPLRPDPSSWSATRNRRSIGFRGADIGSYGQAREAKGAHRPTASSRSQPTSVAAWHSNA
jgi:CRISPR-associated exonuclease Cas4